MQRSLSTSSEMDKLKRFGVPSSGSQQFPVGQSGSRGGSVTAIAPGASARPTPSGSRGNRNYQPRNKRDVKSGGVASTSGGAGGSGARPELCFETGELWSEELIDNNKWRKKVVSHLNQKYVERRHGGGRFSGGGYSNYHCNLTYYQPKYNKEQFLQANCQFVVKDSGDYTVHAADPDILVDWASIELVKIPGQEEANCPICLHPPTAGKMTRCGHVFCWHCILRYLSMSDEKWRKCPICHEAVYPDDLKSVVAETKQTMKPGSEVTMRLMVCQKGTAIPVPASLWSEKEQAHFLNVQDPVPVNYSKLLLIRPDQVESEILSREERELLVAMQDEDPDEMPFIQSALEKLNVRQTESKVHFVSESVEKATPRKQSNSALPSSVPSAKGRVKLEEGFTDAFEDEKRASMEEHSDEIPSGEETSESPVSDAAVGSLSVSPAKGGATVPERLCYFYQAADGQHLYMSTVNFRMLVEQYGNLRRGPSEFTAKVVEVETVSITEEIRKRYRHLAHLPLSCVVHLVELKLEPPVVSDEVMHLFEAELHQREAKRQWKTRKETYRQLEAENSFRKNIRGRTVYSAQGEIMANTEETRETLNLNSEELFPAVGKPAVSPTYPIPAPKQANPESSRSFAEMLRTGKAQPASAPSSTTKKVEASMSSKPTGGHASSEEDDGAAEYRRPENRATYSAALDALLDNAASSSTSQGDGKKKRGKKSKTVMLLSSPVNPRL